MNKNVRLLASLVKVIVGNTRQSRRSAENVPTLYATEPDRFYQEFTYVGSLNQVKAKVVKTELGRYDLLTDQPVLIDTIHYQLLNACNLPESLKIAGKPVVVSGKLYKDTRRILTYLSIGQPFVLSKITSL